MKIICTLAFLSIAGFLQAEDPSPRKYDHLSEMGHSYQYERGIFRLWLYWQSPIWFKGIQTDTKSKEGDIDIQMKPSDHLSTINNGYYHEYYFIGPVKDRLRFDHRTYAYTLGQEEDKKKRIFKGALLKNETFYLPQEAMATIVDYAYYLESHSEEKTWKTR